MARSKALGAEGKLYGAFLNSVTGEKILWLVSKIGLPPEIPGWERRHPCRLLTLQARKQGPKGLQVL
ncbi:MAG TPA: hypothetical protein VLQ45_14785, partial [Thermoanaerobaculia bacterium]|nr:hypothetical protein [Thermoanaerobaculia bacterium]